MEGLEEGGMSFKIDSPVLLRVYKVYIAIKGS